MADLPTLMSGVQLTAHGGPDTLVWNDHIPVRTPGPHEALVRVSAAGVNNTDINTRIGWYASEVTSATASVDAGSVSEGGGWAGSLGFPRIQGGDLCGHIIACGDQVDHLPPGTRVTCPINQPAPSDDNPLHFQALGSEIDGAFAQYCTLDAGQLFDVSASPLSDTEIAAMPCAFGTALNLLRRANIDYGHRVLITGASGGVGLAAVQLATHFGAVITALASGDKQQNVMDAGAHRVITRDAPLELDHFDVVIDVVGGPRWGDFIRALRPGGIYAVSGAIAGPVVAADLRDIYLGDRTIIGCTFQPLTLFGELVDLINSGAVRPLISKTYPLSAIAEAQADFESKQYPGKLVLIPPH